MTQKTCYLCSVTLLIFKTLWFCLQTAFIIKKHMPSKIVSPVLFSMSFLLEDAFCYQQQGGHKRTKLPGQGKASDSELEVWTYMLDIMYHFPATGILHISRCSGEMQRTKTQEHSEEPQDSRVCFAPTANRLLRSAGRVGYTSTL